MKSALRYLSLALASSALMLGPGEAIAGGNDWGWGGWWGHRPAPRISNVDVCVDDYTNELQVFFKATPPGLYPAFPIDATLYGAALCGCADGCGNASFSAVFAGICTEPDVAYRVKGNRYFGSIDLFGIDGFDGAYGYCDGHGAFGGFDWDYITLRIDGYEYPIPADAIPSCNDGWWGDSWWGGSWWWD